MNEELKKKITRSYTRKLNTGNYTSEDFMASWSEEVPANTEDAACTRISAILYGNAKADVELAVLERQKEIAQTRIKEQAKQDYKDDNDL